MFSVCVSEPAFNGDLMYKFRKIIGKMIFLIIKNENKKQIIIRYKKSGYMYNINVLRPTVYLLIILFKVNNFAYLYDCAKAGRASYSRKTRS